MPVFNRNRHSGSSGVAADYIIENSCMFDTTGNTSLTITPGSAASDTDALTISFWFKRGPGGEIRIPFSADSGSGKDVIRFQADDQLQCTMEASNGTAIGHLETTQVFRDPAAWQHLVLIWDSGNVTEADRFQLWINGTRVTAFESGTVYPSQDTNAGGFGQNAVPQAWGHEEDGAARHYDGYIADAILIDGTAYAATSFGEFDDNGNWVATDPSNLTFGTNGYWLDFKDGANMGNDANGGTDWTENNITSANQTSDSPSDDADNNIGNYPTLDGASHGTLVTLSVGNLVATGNSSGNNGEYFATMAAPQTGKFYWEDTITAMTSTYPRLGVASRPFNHLANTNAGSAAAGSGNGIAFEAADRILQGVTTGSYVTAKAATDVEGWALDMDNGALYYRLESTWQQSGDPTSGASKTGAVWTWTPSGNDQRVPAGTEYNGSVTTWNFGQNAFAQAIPTGYTRLYTAAIPAPTITDPSTAFQTTLYTGNGTAIGSGGKVVNQSGNSTFQPDFVWIKNRDTTDQHILTDAARGVTKYISSDGTDAEATAAETLSTFDSDGFTVGSDVQVNTNTEDYVAWQWLAGGGAGASNEAGTINTTTTTVNTTSKFSVSTYTGTGSAATIGHGLLVVPELILAKTVGGADGWKVYHSDLDASAPEDKAMPLNTTGAVFDSAGNWNDTAPTSTVLSLGTDPGVNGSGATHIVYCWASVESYSKIGSYEGNGSTDGMFVWCGFRPAYILTKSIDSTSGWYIFDHKRNGFNAATAGNGNPRLAADEATFGDPTELIDILSNGFKLRIATDPNVAETWIFAAFAEFPFGGDGVSQARAR